MDDQNIVWGTGATPASDIDTTPAGNGSWWWLFGPIALWLGEL